MKINFFPFRFTYLLSMSHSRIFVLPLVYLIIYPSNLILKNLPNVIIISLLCHTQNTLCHSLTKNPRLYSFKENFDPYVNVWFTKYVRPKSVYKCPAKQGYLHYLFCFVAFASLLVSSSLFCINVTPSCSGHIVIAQQACHNWYA
jgi:hypothetical protein